ncbi:hypothetical protein DNU06_13910 [Putridiphycobacter roseus]|uniref:DUF4924 domain-containing protein n=1 Tax=Putridiphycobacter roseus TaxID=2219161 RepID=A0A2W1MVU1_9FLAO|nr:DUF4924 family protein [Putridiphycobacter roseus]PZE16219.1 hypothetical protein DNU06_13910 [Putridiphycobacter roseus]
MQIAKKTKENNISEYVLYMYQIEDLIRANNLSLDTIVTTILKPQIQDESILDAYKVWYADLIKQMKIEGIQKKGHLSDLNEILMEMSLLHNTLINIIKEPKYLKVFEGALPSLKAFQAKSNAGDINLIEIGFNALYSKIILGLKKQSISEASNEAFKSIATMFGFLAAYYKKMKKGELDFANN